MIYSMNNNPKEKDFERLMIESNDSLNREAQVRNTYYLERKGVLLEEDVFRIMSQCAIGTSFENSIQLVSNKAFPDIVAAKYYGVEVKTTTSNHWLTIGNSVLESTRIEDVQRIWLTFGKLVNQVEFKSKRYEECLADIAVTHYPRYKINMNLSPGETIFDKINISYEDLRKYENPVQPIADYYRSILKPKESLWWASERNVEDVSAPAIVKLFSGLSVVEKRNCLIEGLILFPEVFQKMNPRKYDNFILWLATHKAVISTSTRDLFSAGGKCDIEVNGVLFKGIPKVLSHIATYSGLIAFMLSLVPKENLARYWGKEIESSAIECWKEIVEEKAATNYEDIGFYLQKCFENSNYDPTKYQVDPLLLYEDITRFGA